MNVSRPGTDGNKPARPADRMRSRRDPLRMLLDAAQRHGDVAPVPLGRRAVLLVDPRSVRHVLQENRGNYTRGRASRWLRAIWGEGLVLSDGEEWQRQRRQVSPAFHANRLGAVARAIEIETEDTVRRWDHLAGEGQPVSLTTEFSGLTLRVLLRALFGDGEREPVDQIRRSVDRLLGHSDERTTAWIPPPYGLFTPPSLARRVSARLALVRGLKAIVRSRCRAREDRGDLLSVLVTARAESDGAPMNDAWIVDQLLSLLLAGRESTAAALTWIGYLVSRAPEVGRRLATEVDRGFAGQASSTDALRRAPLLQAVVDEGLRLYPPAYKFTREAIGDDEIGGVVVPAGTVVVLSPWVTHRQPKLWKDPESFDPDRFSPARAVDIPPFAYFPFGGGLRLCAGRSFALLEAQLVLALLVRRFRFESTGAGEIPPQAGLVLRPSRDVTVRIHRRTSESRVRPATLPA